MQPLTFAFLLLLLFRDKIFKFIGAIKVTNNIKYNGIQPFATYTVQSFGLAERGEITITYNIQYPTTVGKVVGNNNSSYYVLLLLLSENQKFGWYSAYLSGSQTTDASTVGTLCTLPSTLRRQVYGSGQLTYEISASDGAAQYSVLALQCKTPVPQPQYTFSVAITTEMVNARPVSDGVSQLSIDTVMMPRVLEGAIILYFLMLLGLLGQMVATKQNVMKIHFLFVGTIAITIADNFANYCDLYYYNKNGQSSTSAQFAVNIFGALDDTMQITSLVLLSLGWSLCRSTLSRNQTRILSIAIAAYFTFDLSANLCSSSYHDSCAALSIMALVIHSLLLLVIIISMNFTVTQLKAMLTHNPWVPSTPIQYARCKQYSVFRLWFILYLLLPTAFLLYQAISLTWKESWLPDLMSEVLQLLMFFHIGVIFSPLNEEFLSRAFDGSINGPLNANPVADPGNNGEPAAAEG